MTGGHVSKSQPIPTAMHSCFNYPLQWAVNMQTQGLLGREGGNQRHCNLLFNIYVNSIQICNECFSILHADSARHQNASLTVLGLIMWAAPYCKHKEPPFKRQYNASGIEEKKLTLIAKCTKYSILKCRPTEFPLSSGTHTKPAC